MGKWICDNASAAITPLDTLESFGTHLHVSIKMTYHPSLVGSFSEMPPLEWNEKIVMIEHGNKTRWTFETNMYQHKPDSKTFIVWKSRYYIAYDQANGQGSAHPGSSRLLDKKGQPVPASALRSSGVITRADKTRAVQDYLKTNGGSLLIGIHDKPSLQVPENGEDRERLVLFRCGVRGGVKVFIGMQHLRAQDGIDRMQWKRIDETASKKQKDLPLPQGYTDVMPPAHVTNSKTSILMDGEVN
jgi:hypothetical protein